MSKIADILTGMDDESLANMRTELSAVIESRQKRPQLEDIKAGMKPEDLDKARAEVARVLKESGYSK